ncbi:MAG: DUF2283 domain-containing protein [Thermodesulfobacteriota bacterium]
MEALKIQEKQANLDWEYDKEADVLYISVGKPKEAEGMDIGEGTIARLDPQSGEVVGLTIIGLRQRVTDALEKVGHG